MPPTVNSPDGNIWLINVISNLGLGIILLSIIKFFLDRFIKQIDEKFSNQENRISANAKEIHEIKENYIDRFENVKDHFSDQISQIVQDKNNYRIANASIISQITQQINNIFEAIKRIERKIFKDE